MSTPSSKTVALFGATGGTGLAVLKRCLEAGYTVNVLARTPSKLSVFTSKYTNLHVIKGDIQNIESIKSTLTFDHKVVDVVISAIGMVIQMEGLKFTSLDQTICERGTKSILNALSQIESGNEISLPVGGPVMVLLSSTGISDQGRDIPIAMVPLYHWMLAMPHKDKKNMENVMVSGEGRDRNWIIVRPSLLFNGDSKGMDKIRISTETPSATEKQRESVALGYRINREDVGLWIFENCVKARGEEWYRKMVVLTY